MLDCTGFLGGAMKEKREEKEEKTIYRKPVLTRCGKLTDVLAQKS